jgi:hypothetical protein
MQHNSAANAIIAGLQAVTRDWAKQRKAEERDQNRRDKRWLALRREREVSIKDAVYTVIEQAYLKASANNTLPAMARQVMYQVRPLIQAYTNKPLDDDYFTQTLLPDYVSERDLDWNIVYDERGHLLEPHTGKTIGLGTLPVRQYLRQMKSGPYFSPASFAGAEVETCGPEARFGAVLFIEKEGFFPLFEEVRLAERYDLGIMSTKGMSNTSARELIDEMCSKHGIPALVLHDFDKSGFSILGTLQNDNRRYEFKHKPQIIDLGLRLADIDGLQSEAYHPGANIERNLRSNGATQEEAEFLLKRRVELNAFASDDFVRFIERKLEENGIKKVVPKRDVLAKAYRLFVDSRRLEAIVEVELGKASYRFIAVPEDLEKRVRTMLAKHPEMRWDSAVRSAAETDGFPVGLQAKIQRKLWKSER